MTVYIVGTSPTLSSHDLSLLDHSFTIGINRCYLTGFVPTILLWQDASFMLTERERVRHLKCYRVAKDNGDPAELAHFRFSVERRTEWSRRPDVLCSPGASLPCACQLATCLGATRLVLLGCDCSLGANGDTDYYGVNPFHRPQTMDGCRRGLEFVRSHCPVELVEPTDLSELTIEQIDIQAELDRIKLFLAKTKEFGKQR